MHKRHTALRENNDPANSFSVSIDVKLVPRGVIRSSLGTGLVLNGSKGYVLRSYT